MDASGDCGIAAPTKWCNVCKMHISCDRFHKNQLFCKDCRNRYKRLARLRNPKPKMVVASKAGLDLVGTRRGRLLIKSVDQSRTRGKQNGKRTTYLLVECDCGQVKSVARNSLTSRSGTYSCGCYKLDMLRERTKSAFGEATFNQVFNTYKNSASERCLVFDLDKKSFRDLSQQNCYYCGDPPSNRQSSQFNNGDYVYNGLDRVNNSIGYVEGNCVPCCWSCNTAKNDESHDDFLLRSMKIAARVTSGRIGFLAHQSSDCFNI